jgi:mycothiol system anti-sigma-R factor
MSQHERFDASGNECDDALTNLYQYLDKELNTASSQTIKAHLDECNGCSDMFDFENRLKTVVHDRLAEDVPPEFIDRLHQALRDESASAN